MKKISSVLVIVLFGMLLTACGGGSTGVSDTVPTTNVVPASDVGSTTEAVPTTEVVPTSESAQQKVDLSWAPPATRTDGSALTLSDVEGYKIYVGTSPDNLVLQEDLLGVSETQITLTLSEPGTYYFAVTAYDKNGLESSFSEKVLKEIG